MKRKRLDRDIDWGFQYFPYYQLRLDAEGFHGLASMIDIISGEEFCWDFERAGKAPVSGGGMKWLQLIPDGKSRLITAMYKPDGALSVCYIDIIERIEFDPDGVAAFVDKYLDVVFTPEGDAGILDRDELDDALKSGDITNRQYDAALKECENIFDEMCRDIPKSVLMLGELYKNLCEKVKNGVEPMMTKYQKELIERGLTK